MTLITSILAWSLDLMKFTDLIAALERGQKIRLSSCGVTKEFEVRLAGVDQVGTV